MYEEYYNFSENPFRLTPNPKFYFASKGHERVIAYLRYGIERAEGFVVVTGMVGTGKTTLIQTLLNDIDKREDLITAQLTSTQLEADDLLKMISASFNLEYKGLSKPEIIKNMEGFLKEQARHNKRVLLIVDEAQNLPYHSLEELRMLSNSQVNGRQLLQSFLVGQDEFKKILNAEYLRQLRQRIIASYHVGPLNKDETEEYIKHRLSQVGWVGDPRFTPDAFSEIYGYSHGIPRKINLLCDRILLYGSLEELKTINVDAVKNVIAEIGEEVLDVHSITHGDMNVENSDTVMSDHIKTKNALEERVTRIERILSDMSDILSTLNNK